MILGTLTGNLKVTRFPVLGLADFVFAFLAQLIRGIRGDDLCKNPGLLRQSGKTHHWSLHSLYLCTRRQQIHRR